MEALLELPFDRLVMAHGDVVERNGRDALFAGTWWMRGESRRPTTSTTPIPAT